LVWGGGDACECGEIREIGVVLLTKRRRRSKRLGEREIRTTCPSTVWTERNVDKNRAVPEAQKKTFL